MRYDITEGSSGRLLDLLPLISYGRIRSLPEINEWIMEIRIAGEILFLATGKYRYLLNDNRSYFRWWLA